MRMSSFDTVLNDFLFALIKFYAHIRYLGPSITSIQYYMALWVWIKSSKFFGTDSTLVIWLSWNNLSVNSFLGLQFHNYLWFYIVMF